MFDIIWRSVAIGIGATVLMDLWAMFLHLALSQPRPNWAPPGRWVWHLKDGKVFHDDIAHAAPYPHETALGWAFHYFTGGQGKILYLADGNGDFAKSIGLDFISNDMGLRARRFSMIVDNGKVTALNVETKPGVDTSGAAHILSQL